MVDIKQNDILIKTPLSNTDMINFEPTAKDKIIEYNELAKYNDIEEILTHDKDYRIILIEYTDNNGHWILISRHADTIELFNPFGLRPSKNDFVVDKKMNEFLGQSSLHLNRLMQDEKEDLKFNVIYNKFKFQKKSILVNTCGRHVMLRLICMLHYDMDLEQYLRFIKKAKSKLKLKNYDQVVSELIR
jgi:hypothetical protein